MQALLSRIRCVKPSPRGVLARWTSIGQRQRATFFFVLPYSLSNSGAELRGLRASLVEQALLSVRRFESITQSLFAAQVRYQVSAAAAAAEPRMHGGRSGCRGGGRPAVVTQAVAVRASKQRVVVMGKLPASADCCTQAYARPPLGQRRGACYCACRPHHVSPPFGSPQHSPLGTPYRMGGGDAIRS